MRPRTGSTLAAILLFVPLMAVPLLAVFGVPEFASVSASPSAESVGDAPLMPIETRVGESLRYTPDELFSPFTETAGSVPVRPVRSISRAEREGPSLPAEALAGWEFADDWPADARPLRAATEALADAGAPPARRGPRSTAEVPSARERVPARHPPEPALRETAVDRPLEGPRPIDRRETRPPARRDPLPGDPQGVQPVAHLEPADGPPLAEPSASNDARTAPRSRPADAPLRAAPATEPQPLTWNAAVARLKQLGIREFRLSPGSRADAFHFSCSYTPQDNPRITHRFEAEASEPLRAVEKVLAQIDEWQGLR
ncbi:MAG: hypothetical protein WD069_01050 [Planctomycetales bacterium]